MNITDLLNEAVILDSETSLAKTISAMESKKTRGVIVTKNNEYLGVVDAKDVLRKQVGNPDKLKIESLAKKVPVGSAEYDIKELAGMVLAGDYADLPFRTDEGLKTLSKGAIIRLLDKDIFSDMKARDIMNVPYFVHIKDTLGDTKRLLLDLNVSKLPVIDDSNKVVGLVDSLNMLSTITKRTRQKTGGYVAEKRGVEGVEVSSFMERDINIVNETDPINKVIEKLSTDKAATVLVESEGLLVGIITPKDILKLVGRKKEDLFMNLSGYVPDDEIEFEHIKETAKKTLEKLQKVVHITYAVMHIERHGKDSVKSQYTVSARLGTHIGLFTADDTGWDLSATIKSVMEKILKTVEKDIGKRRKYKRIKE